MPPRLLVLPASSVPLVLQEAFELAEKLPEPRPQHSGNDDVHVLREHGLGNKGWELGTAALDPEMLLGQKPIRGKCDATQATENIPQHFVMLHADEVNRERGLNEHRVTYGAAGYMSRRDHDRDRHFSVWQLTDHIL